MRIADLHRLDRVQVLRFQSRQRLLFLQRQMIDVLQEDVAPALDLEVVLGLLTPHFVDGLVCRAALKRETPDSMFSMALFCT